MPACVRISLVLLLLGICALLVDPGPEFAHPSLVKTPLTPLASVGASFQYPPINWSAVLSPLMRLSFGKSSHIFVSLRPRLGRVKVPSSASFFFFWTGEDVQHQCVVLAACQAQSSQSASLFLGSWLSPPLVHSLSVSSS